MTKVRGIDSSPHEQAGEMATYWFGRSRQGMTDRDEAEFRTWLARSDENRTAYDDVTRAWEFLGSAASHPGVAAMRTEALWMRPGRRFSFSQWSVAAALLLTVTIGSVFFRSNPFRTGIPAELAAADATILKTAIGDRSSTVLDDGSVITLNTNSKVRIALSERSRNVTLLSGQAFFKVAKDKTRPFIVTAGSSQVLAVGTEFDVVLEARGVRVALLEGSVNVAHVRSVTALPSGSAPARLVAGQLLFADRESGRMTVTSSDVQRLLSWRQGRVRFEETPLSEAVADMNRYTKLPIRVVDPDIAGLKISGAFRAGETNSFVSSITSVFPVRATSTPSGVELRSAP